MFFPIHFNNKKSYSLVIFTSFYKCSLKRTFRFSHLF